MYKFHNGDYLRDLAKRMKSQLAKKVEDREQKRENFEYNSDFANIWENIN